MPKLDKISDTHYRYNCECGCEINYYTDTPPKRVPKCFECLGKGTKIEDKKNITHNKKR